MTRAVIYCRNQPSCGSHIVGDLGTLPDAGVSERCMRRSRASLIGTSGLVGGQKPPARSGAPGNGRRCNQSRRFGRLDRRRAADFRATTRRLKAVVAGTRNGSTLRERGKGDAEAMSVLIAVLVGLATAFFGWLLLRLFFQPRFTIEGSGTATDEMFMVRVGNRRGRTVIDMTVSCSLRIPHGQGQENDLTLETPGGFFPIVDGNWHRDIRISMALNTLTAFGRTELANRLSKLAPPGQISARASIARAIQLIEAAQIEVAVSASDRLTGVRNVEAKRIRPATFA